MRKTFRKGKDEMIYAPIIIPTLCRYEHFKRCLESLKKNSYALMTDVYIAVDYPLNSSHKAGYRKICEYLQDVKGFASVNIIFREKNYGAHLNQKMLIENIIQKKYDRWIRTDDDVEFSENFLEYMDKCLDTYENDPSIIAVCGYSYPCNYSFHKDVTVFRQDCYLPMWGAGFWKDKYLEMKVKIEDEYYLHNTFDSNLKNGKWKNLIDARYLDFIDAGLSYQKNKLAFWTTDIACATYMGLENKYVIMPVISKARNNGFDGSGVTCPNISGDFFSKQDIDKDNSFRLYEDKNSDSICIRKIINDFDYRPKRKMFKAKIKLMLYRLLGEKGWHWLWMIRNKNKYNDFIS